MIIKRLIKQHNELQFPMKTEKVIDSNYDTLKCLTMRDNGLKFPIIHYVR